MVPFQLVARARGRLTFHDTPSEPLDANRRNHAETAASHRAVPIGAFEMAPEVGTNALGRCRAVVGRWKFVAWLKAGPAPFSSSAEGGTRRASFLGVVASPCPEVVARDPRPISQRDAHDCEVWADADTGSAIASTPGRRASDAASARHAPEPEAAATSLQILLDSRSEHKIEGRGCDATARHDDQSQKCG